MAFLDSNGVKTLSSAIKQEVLNTIVVGATSSTAGEAGLVPSPGAGDNTKFLRGDGTWQAVSGGSSGVTSFNGETGAVTLNIHNGSGDYSIAEEGASASGDYSHGEGYSSLASGNYSHAEGNNTYASGVSSHAEGGGTHASCVSSHAEGNVTFAMSDYSHAEGNNVYAVGRSCHAFGEFNIYEDPSQIPSSYKGNYVEIVGNGTSTSALSNARTLDWNGNEVLAGTVTASGFIGDGSQLTNLPLAATLLWTNASPTSRFVSQNINISPLDYDCILIISLEFNTSTRHIAELIFKGVEGAIHCFSSTNNRNGIRVVRFAGNIWFDSCNYNNGTNNDYCIPYKIYGLKLVNS